MTPSQNRLDGADEVLSTLTVEIVLSNALSDHAAYDRATNEILGRKKAA